MHSFSANKNELATCETIAIPSLDQDTTEVVIVKLHDEEEEELKDSYLLKK